jgi:two-component system, NarL family, nitrate/nitrite response regulator NarL
MVAIAIVSADPVLRQSLERLPRGDPTITAVAVAKDPTAVLALIDHNQVDVVLVDLSSREQLTDWRIQHCGIPFIVLVGGLDDERQSSINALHAGWRAILHRSAGREEIVAAIKAVMSGLAVLPHELLPTLLDGASLGDELMDRLDGDHARLTPRELEVLAAMANGASNKAIARQLGISVHTAKFHVAAILAKLNADSRTEAVMRAAQLGLVML